MSDRRYSRDNMSGYRGGGGGGGRGRGGFSGGPVSLPFCFLLS